LNRFREAKPRLASIKLALLTGFLDASRGS